MNAFRHLPEYSLLRNELDSILHEELLQPLFMPIVSLSGGQILGYEGLIRGPSNSPLHSPFALLQAADRFGQLLATERLCCRTILRRFAELELHAQLFLNISPECLLHPEFAPEALLYLLQELGLNPASVVIELTETRPMPHYATLHQVVSHYRRLQFGIAIDDLSGGLASMQLCSELEPDYVKIDKHFMEGIERDPIKQQFVSEIQTLSLNARAKTVAEGIESAEELQFARRLGLDCGQGLLLGRPEASPRTHLSQAAQRALALSDPSLAPRNLLSRSQQIAGQLLLENPAVAITITNEQVYDFFVAQPALYAIPVLDAQQCPIGLMRRGELLEHFAKPFNRELHAKKPCTLLMDRNPLVVDSALSLAGLSQLLIAADRRYLTDGFILTQQGRYLGMGTGHDLIRAISEIQINAARYANPLTLLPGNVPINEQVELLLEADTPFVAVFADLNHFKPFNDVYGYRRGDEVIQLLGRVLSTAASGGQDFVGHVGGDDFVVLFQSEDWETRCRRILGEFETQVNIHFDAEHIQQGGYVSQDRQGKEILHPLVSLALAAVPAHDGRFHSHHEVAAVLAEAKRQAKRSTGNTLFIDRRA